MLSWDEDFETRGGTDKGGRSLTQEFWALLNLGAVDAAMDIARRLALPPVRSFSFAKVRADDGLQVMLPV